MDKLQRLLITLILLAAGFVFGRVITPQPVHAESVSGGWIMMPNTAKPGQSNVEVYLYSTNTGEVVAISGTTRTRVIEKK